MSPYKRGKENRENQLEVRVGIDPAIGCTCI